MSNVFSSLVLDVAEMRRPHPRTTLAALAYLVSAIALSGLLILLAPLDAHSPVLIAAIALAVAACIAERVSRRASDALAKNTAPAIYIMAALLLPTPWAVLIAAVSVVICYLARGEASTETRITATAHTVVVTVLFTLLAHAVGGDMTLRRALFSLAGGPSAIRHISTLPLFSDPAHLLSLQGMLGLVVGFYLLDTLPLTIMAADREGVAPWRAWCDAYARKLLVDLATPSLAILASTAYVTARPAAALAVVALAGLAWPFERTFSHLSKRRLARDEQASEVLRALPSPPHNGVSSQSQDVLNGVLAAVKAVSGAGDQVVLAQTLAREAGRLTRASTCVVYLYDAPGGAFVAHAANDGAPRPERDKPMLRAAVERLLDEENRLGNSYYTRVGSQIGAGLQRWRATDTLLVPLQLKNGDIMGVIALHAPDGSAAPTADELVPIEVLAYVTADMIARLRHTDQAMHLASVDPLTGLLNRRALEDRLRRELNIARQQRSLALLMIDLDDFSAINSTHGHQAGDAALQLVAGVIRTHLRHHDMAGRYGGDEFVVILPNVDTAHALEVAERLRGDLMAVTTRVAAKGELPHIHTSIGVASSPADAIDMDCLVKAADDALSQAKRLGKNNVASTSVH